MRKTLATKGKVEEEMTPLDISHKISNELEDKGCTMIYAHPERVQAMRHQTGQLGGLGAVSLEEV
ncbi:MAG: hypothetical protein IPK55_12190 [Streptococcus sp.]|nr:hypothetical protein [Streptococcus sp.]